MRLPAYANRNADAGGRIQRKRAVLASAIVSVAVLAIPVSNSVAGAAVDSAPDASAANAQVEVGLEIENLYGAEDPFAVLDRIEASAEATGQLPSAFVDEAGVPVGAREVRGTADGAVVGCVLEADAEAAFGEVSSVLESKGWTAVPLQGVVGATFVKGSGLLRWMLVTCTEAGEATAVVFRMADIGRGEAV